MKQMAMEGVRDAVITQLAIIGVQRLMNVLTLGGSAFADAAKMIYDMILFFKNNWRKIVDLVTKIFNTLSAVADNDTKGVADGIEGTMGRGLQVIFGFFMTSLGLNGVVNTVINVFRKIGDFLRKAVQKGVDMVVNWVKDKFKGLFKRRGAGAEEEEEDSQNQEDKPALTAADHARHERFVNEMAIELKEEDPSKPSNFAEFYAAKQKLSRQLELRYNKRLGKVNGIPLKTTITMGSLSQELEDNDLDVKIKIAPNDTERELPLPFVDADFMKGNENGWIILFRGIQFEAKDEDAQEAYKHLATLIKYDWIHRSQAANELQNPKDWKHERKSQTAVNDVLSYLGESTEVERYQSKTNTNKKFANKWRAMVSHFVNDHEGFKESLAEGKYKPTPFSLTPFISTSKRAIQAAKYSCDFGKWQKLKDYKDSVELAYRKKGLNFDEMKEAGRIFIYRFKMEELNQEKAIDIKKSVDKKILSVGGHISKQDEVTFMAEVPTKNLWNRHVTVPLSEDRPKLSDLAAKADSLADAAAGGKEKRRHFSNLSTSKGSKP